jgi:hypothetical protein
MKEADPAQRVGFVSHSFQVDSFKTWVHPSDETSWYLIGATTDSHARRAQMDEAAVQGLRKIQPDK